MKSKVLGTKSSLLIGSLLVVGGSLAAGEQASASQNSGFQELGSASQIRNEILVQGELANGEVYLDHNEHGEEEGDEHEEGHDDKGGTEMKCADGKCG